MNEFVSILYSISFFEYFLLLINCDYINKYIEEDKFTNQTRFGIYSRYIFITYIININNNRQNFKTSKTLKRAKR
jgi:hypothetical protein